MPIVSTDKNEIVQCSGAMDNTTSSGMSVWIVIVTLSMPLTFSTLHSALPFSGTKPASCSVVYIKDYEFY